MFDAQFLKENIKIGYGDCFWRGKLNDYETGESGKGERTPFHCKTFDQFELFIMCM